MITKQVLIFFCLIPGLFCLESGFCEDAGDRGVEKNACVILLHGLGRTKQSMVKIEKRLKALGYLIAVVIFFGYSVIPAAVLSNYIILPEGVH